MAADFKFFNEEIKQPAATNKSISNLEVFDFKLNWKKKKGATAQFVRNTGFKIPGAMTTEIFFFRI